MLTDTQHNPPDNDQVDEIEPDELDQFGKPQTPDEKDLSAGQPPIKHS